MNIFELVLFSILVATTSVKIPESLKVKYIRPLEYPKGGNYEISKKSTYVLGYNEEAEMPAWVMYYLNRDDFEATDVYRQNDFRQDTSISTLSADFWDYAGTGYDKGHLLPSQDRTKSIEANSETFLMSNMTPQDPSFNRGIWKRLENKTRNYVKNYGKVCVITGPIISPTFTKINSVTVPDYFYKIIIKCTEPEVVLAYVIPNKSSNYYLWDYAVPVSFIEAITGLQFDLGKEDWDLRYEVNTKVIWAFEDE